MFEFWWTAFLFFLTEVFAVVAIHSLFEWGREQREASNEAAIAARYERKDARASATSSRA